MRFNRPLDVFIFIECRKRQRLFRVTQREHVTTYYLSERIATDRKPKSEKNHKKFDIAAGMWYN